MCPYFTWQDYKYQSYKLVHYPHLLQHYLHIDINKCGLFTREQFTIIESSDIGRSSQSNWALVWIYRPTRLFAQLFLRPWWSTTHHDLHMFSNRCRFWRLTWTWRWRCRAWICWLIPNGCIWRSCHFVLWKKERKRPFLFFDVYICL